MLRYHVRVARVTEVHWAHLLNRPPTASPVELGTGVLWGQPGPTRVALHPGRMMEKPERQPYVHWTTCYDYRGDVDYRRVFLHIADESRHSLLARCLKELEDLQEAATMTCVNGSTELNWLAPGSWS